MKKKSKWVAVLVPLVITISLYLVFYPNIATKPSDAGFWIILAMGMATGVFLNLLFRGSKSG